MKLRLHYDKAYFDCLSKEQSINEKETTLSKTESIDISSFITVTDNDIKRISYTQIIKSISMLGFCLSMDINIDNFYGEDGFNYNNENIIIDDDDDDDDDDVGVFVSAPITLTSAIASTKLVSEKHFYKLISKDLVALQLFESIGLFTRLKPQCSIIVIIPILISSNGGDIALGVALPNEKFGFIFDSCNGCNKRNEQIEYLFKQTESNIDIFFHYLCQYIKPIPKSIKSKKNITVYHTSNYPKLRLSFNKYAPFYYFFVRFRHLLEIIKDNKNGLFKKKKDEEDLDFNSNNTVFNEKSIYNSKRSTSIIDRIIKEISLPIINDIDDEILWIICGNFVYEKLFNQLKRKDILFNNPFFKSMRPTVNQTKSDWLRKNRDENFKALKKYTQLSKEYADNAKERTKSKIKRETGVSNIDPVLFK